MLVERIEIVSAFRRDPTIVLSIGPKVARLAKRLNAQIRDVRVPENAPPEIPRLVVQLDRAILQIGLNRFHLQAQAPEHVAGNLEESMAFAMQLFEPTLADFYAGDDAPQFEWTGIVATLNYPTSAVGTIVSGTEAIYPVFTRLTTLNWENESLASFDMRVGRRSDGYFTNYTIAGYEMRELTVLADGTQNVTLDLGSVPVSQSGITVTLDVNSRPSGSKHGPTEDLARTSDRHFFAFSSMASDLNLEGMI